MFWMIPFDHCVKSIIVGYIPEETFHQEHVVYMSQLDNHWCHEYINFHLWIKIQ